MQFVPQRSDLEQALRKAKPPEYTVPSGRSPETQQIHDIFVNTPIPPDIFENYRTSHKPKPQEKPQQQSPRKPRDLQAELRALNLVPNSNEGPKRGTGTLLPQQDNMGMPGMPGMPGFPGFPAPHPAPFHPAFGARHTVGNQNNVDPNNYDDFQDIENDEEEQEAQDAQDDGNNEEDGEDN